jgi:hypothetical protein
MDTAAPPNTAAFAPDAVEAINRAYDHACDLAGTSSGNEELRLKLAEHIMNLARNGETDADRLCSLAIRAVTGQPTKHESGGAAHASPDFRNGGAPPAALPGATGTGENLKI